MRKQWTLTLFVFSVALLIWVLIRFLIPLFERDRIPHPEPEKPVAGQIRGKNEALHDWIDQLAKYEACPSQGIVDINGKRSYGKFCFQKDTFLWFAQEFYERGLFQPQAELEELENFLYVDEAQKELAILIFSDDLNNWRHWWTSVVVRKLGLPPSLD